MSIDLPSTEINSRGNLKLIVIEMSQHQNEVTSMVFFLVHFLVPIFDVVLLCLTYQLSGYIEINWNMVILFALIDYAEKNRQWMFQEIGRHPALRCPDDSGWHHPGDRILLFPSDFVMTVYLNTFSCLCIFNTCIDSRHVSEFVPIVAPRIMPGNISWPLN